MKRIKSKMFVKNIIKLLIPLLVPILILGALSLMITQRYVTHEIDSNTAKLLNQSQESVDSLLNEINAVNINFGINPSVTIDLKRIFNNSSMTLDDIREINILQSLLSAPAYSKPYIDSIYVYFDNPYKRFMSTTDAVTTVDSVIDKGWYNSFLQDGNTSASWCEVRNVKHYDFESTPTTLLTVYRSINSSVSNKSIGVIVLNLRVDYIISLLNNAKSFPDQAIVITDSHSHILVGNNRKTDFGPIINRLPGSGGSFYQDGYSITELGPDNYGLKLYSFIPYTQKYATPINLLEITLVSLAFSFAIGLMLTYYFTKKNYQHIYEIIDVIDLAQSGEPLPPLPIQIKDEYSYISYNIIKTFIEQNYLKIQLSEKKYRMKAMELLALQSQMNPHFLFNTLETIYLKSIGLTGRKNDVTVMIEDLSTILKYSLSDPDESIAMKDEIENSKSYINLQKIRYREKVNVLWDCDDRVKSYRVIKLILQPLLENSIYHGLKEKDGPGKIKVRIKKCGSAIRFAIIDNGIGISREKLYQIRNGLSNDSMTTQNIGLTNTNKRLKLNYGEEYFITIKSKFGLGTAVHFAIPIDNS